jgi:hypothetical protein
MVVQNPLGLAIAESEGNQAEFRKQVQVEPISLFHLPLLGHKRLSSPIGVLEYFR